MLPSYPTHWHCTTSIDLEATGDWELLPQGELGTWESGHIGRTGFPVGCSNFDRTLGDIIFPNNIVHYSWCTPPMYQQAEMISTRSVRFET